MLSFLICCNPRFWEKLEKFRAGDLARDMDTRSLMRALTLRKRASSVEVGSDIGQGHGFEGDRPFVSGV